MDTEEPPGKPLRQSNGPYPSFEERCTLSIPLPQFDSDLDLITPLDSETLNDETRRCWNVHLDVSGLRKQVSTAGPPYWDWGDFEFGSEQKVNDEGKVPITLQGYSEANETFKCSRPAPYLFCRLLFMD
ncbi:hypothetical protein EPUS_07419 [Endocarpon pusillum Z07020]|uniref:Uncharacterized protein n=1 Tax=Endocarpon pusillum (strain Z07020 / HMAS-L-300199) TaxID=1263415 RepID=U1GHV2_ENDPU|nr:uncharacterized protein EPUS_07419 [Endocarpon pusillum Z07020]ERF71391.1 hypothetical protein EPUS_07419 [Endocarpon pusillum Z07020]